VFEFPLRHPGQYDDPETGLFYNYFRDYDPSLGRYLETDPLGVLVPVELESATSLRLQNTYAYVDSNPLRLVDPTGEMAVSLDLRLPGINRISCYRFCNTITAAILSTCRMLRNVQAILWCTSGAAAFDIACIARCNRTYRR
jgi:RHS repeat-associated protein